MKIDQYFTGKSKNQFVMQRLVLISIPLFMVVALLSPGAALAHPSGVTQRVSVDSAGE